MEKAGARVTADGKDTRKEGRKEGRTRPRRSLICAAAWLISFRDAWWIGSLGFALPRESKESVRLLCLLPGRSSKCRARLRSLRSLAGVNPYLQRGKTPQMIFENGRRMQRRKELGRFDPARTGQYDPQRGYYDPDLAHRRAWRTRVPGVLGA